MKTDTPKISVLIPVYGVESYVKCCVESLMNQTLKEGVELLFIDDASKDKSIEIIQSVIDAHPDYPGYVKIIHHKINKGLPSARNTGLAAAHGEYIVHIDGDDFPEPRMLELMYKAATDNDADFVWCDYYLAFPDKKRILSQPAFSTPLDAVRGMLRGSMKYNVWNKMCRRSLYIDNGITFPDGYPMGEDLTMIKVALHANKCAVVNEPLYNYVQSPNQMTAVYNEAKLQSLLHNCECIWEYINKNFSCLGLQSEYAALCQLMKWPFLLDGEKSSYLRWHQWFPESNKLIWKTKGVNKRIKFVEWCAAKHLWPLVWLHYVLVIKIYYGIVYNK